MTFFNQQWNEYPPFFFKFHLLGEKEKEGKKRESYADELP